MSKTNPKMYIILREDLAYKYIQGGHALAQFALSHPIEFKEWNNSFLICLSVFNGLCLKEVLDFIISDENYNTKFKVQHFYEPDLQSQLPTAIAIFEDGSGLVSKITAKLSKALSLATK